MSVPKPVIAILGANGLIGSALTHPLAGEGFPVVAIARSTIAGDHLGAVTPVKASVVSLDPSALGRLLDTHRVSIVVNCIGVLQDSSKRGTAAEAHVGFASRLLQALDASPSKPLLIHVSIPGSDLDDQTEFSRSKRQAERLIEASAVPSVIIRPGFVIAQAAYGGSALIRALAALPVKLPDFESSRPFAVTDVGDIVRTAAAVAKDWEAGDRHWKAEWDVMSDQPTTVADVVAGFRRQMGVHSRGFGLHPLLLKLGAKIGDASAWLGWAPPVRSTALAEMRRGVRGDPASWMAATGITPRRLNQILASTPATVQERWFARLYLIKPMAIAGLATFWLASGVIALTIAFQEAVGILTRQGWPEALAQSVTVATSLGDIAIGTAISVRRTCGIGLVAGICLAAVYAVSAAIFTPTLWIDPLGAMVKIGPAIILMALTLAILDDR